MLSTVLLVLLLSNYCLAQNDSKKCRLSQLETKLRSLIGQFGMRDHKWPETEDEMQLWCKSLPKEGSAAKSYSKKCLNGMSGTIVSVSIFAADKVGRGYCNNKQERAGYIARGPCGNKAKSGTARCWSNLINVMSNIKNMSVNTDKIPSVCCAFFEWRDCSIEVYNKVGEPVCTTQVVEGFQTHIGRGSLDPLNILCSDYDESDKCDKFKAKFVRTAPSKRYRTPFPAIIEVFESL